MDAVLAVLDYSIDLAEKADAKFHEATGAIDAYLHSTVTKLRALRERLTMTFSAGEAGASAVSPAYESLGSAGKIEVEELAAKIRETV
jgi:hypothetical protein